MNKKILSIALSLACLIVPAAQAEKYPIGTNVINVKDFGAVGDGVHDDTPNILNAIKRYVGMGRILYFPKGTYIITKPLECRRADRDGKPQWMDSITFMGESRTETILKLKDKSAGFWELTATPKAMIKSGTIDDDTGAANDDAEGDSEPTGYRNNIFDLTLDTGLNNPKAIGIDYIGNNRAAIRNVTVRCLDRNAGRSLEGIRLTRQWNGPCLIQNVTVDGFVTGIMCEQIQYGITMDKIVLKNQKEVGIVTGNQSLHIYDLTSTNTVPAIKQDSLHSQLTLIKARLNGGLNTNAAIETGSAGPFPYKTYIRDIATTGYGAELKMAGTPVQIAPGAEYLPQPVLKLFTSPEGSLKLPIESAPAAFTSGVASQWAIVAGNPNDTTDDTDAIQAAIDTGKPILCFRPNDPTIDVHSGDYYISRTITIPPHVKRIIGMETYIKATDTFPAGQPLFRFTGGASSDVTTLEQFWMRADLNGGHYIEHNSPRTLCLRHIHFGGGQVAYKNRPGAGKLFITDCLGMRWNFDYPQTVWARQLNTEEVGGGVFNTGARVWILGLKTEADFTAITTRGGGSTELLGGFLMPGITLGAPRSTAFVNGASNHSLIYTVYYAGLGEDFPVHVTETRGVSRSLPSAGVVDGRIRNETRKYVPLFTGYLPEIVEEMDYPAGALNGKNGGNGWSGPWTAAAGVNVASGSIPYGGISPAGSKAQGAGGLTATRSFRYPIEADGVTRWVAVLMHRTGPNASVSFPNVILKDALNANQIRMYTPQNDSQWRVQIGTQVSPNFSNGIANPGLLLMKITFKAGNDDVKVWVNPTNFTSGEAGLGTGHTFAGLINLSLAKVTMTLGGTAGGSVDEFRIGNSLTEVISRFGQPPTPPAP